MDKRQQVIDISSLYLSAFISCIPNGILIVLMSVKMKEHIGDDILISFVFTAQTIAGILFAKYIPSFAKKFGMINSIHIASVVAAIISILFYRYINYFVWMGMVFVFGMSLFSFVVIRQTMLLNVAPKKYRATLSSASGMFVALGISLGSLMVKYIGHEGINPHLICAGLYLLSSVPMLFIKGIDCSIKKSKKISLWRYIHNSPKIMFGGFSFNYASSSVTAFLVIYGLKTGMSTAQASVLFSVLLLGTVFSIPMGFITDRINRRFLMLVCTIISLSFAILIPLSHDIDVTAILLFMMFGFSIGIKLPALILIHEKYKPTQRLAVVSAFNKICQIGSIAGITATGIFMKTFGPMGLWISVIVAMSSYLLFTIYNYLHKFMNNNLTLGDFFIKHD